MLSQETAAQAPQIQIMGDVPRDACPAPICFFDVELSKKAVILMTGFDGANFSDHEPIIKDN
jgi:hypothetical protein